jgi:spermidine synthase
VSGADRLRPVVRIESGRKVLRVGGVAQSMEVVPGRRPDVWDAMVPWRHAVRRALLLGLGGGTVAAILTQRFGRIPITAVDCDRDVVTLARQHFGVGELPNLRIVLGDAFAFTRDDPGPYDLICVDLFRANRMPPQVLGAGFLRDVGRLLSDRGMATINLFLSARVPAQVARIHQHLRVRHATEVEGNVVVHCSPRHAGD